MVNYFSQNRIQKEEKLPSIGIKINPQTNKSSDLKDNGPLVIIPNKKFQTPNTSPRKIQPDFIRSTISHRQNRSSIQKRTSMPSTPQKNIQNEAQLRPLSKEGFLEVLEKYKARLAKPIFETNDKVITEESVEKAIDQSK